MMSKSLVLNAPAIWMPLYHDCSEDRLYPLARWIMIFVDDETERTAFAAECKSCDALL